LTILEQANENRERSLREKVNAKACYQDETDFKRIPFSAPKKLVGAKQIGKQNSKQKEEGEKTKNRKQKKENKFNLRVKTNLTVV